MWVAKFDAVVPYSFAQFSGQVNNVDSSIFRSGFDDPLFRLSAILIGKRRCLRRNICKLPKIGLIWGCLKNDQ